MNDFRQDFAKRLSLVRQVFSRLEQKPNQLTMSMGEFADRLGINRARYRRYERGELEPNLEVLTAIFQMTGISLNFLVAGSDIPEDLQRLTGRCRATFGQRMQYAREMVGLDVIEAATLMGVSAATYRKWESGKEPLPVDQIEVISHRFRVSREYLIDGQPKGLSPGVLQQLLEAQPNLWSYDNRSTAMGGGKALQRNVPKVGRR